MGHIDRRQLLIGGTAGALGIAAAALGSTTALADEGKGLVGTWDVWITDKSRGGPAVEGATTFAPGGGIVTMDSGNASTGIGSWTGGDEGGGFKGRFMQFAFNPDGSTAGKVIVTIPDGKRSGNTIRGSFTYVIYALNGTPIFSNGHGTFTGTRFAAA